MTIKRCEIDINRTEELESVLEYLSHAVIAYAKKADGQDGRVGFYTEPKALAAKLAVELPTTAQGPEGLKKDVQLLLENSVVTWNKGFLDKLYASTNPVGIASDLLLSILNTNSHVYTVSPALTVIERQTARKYAQAFGFNGPYAGGLTFPGGSYSNMTSLNIARSILYPETKTQGNGSYKFALFSSSHCHYSVEKAAMFCGLGSESLFKVKVHADGTMDVTDLERQIVLAKQQGFTPFYINATAGTTVYGSYDDFGAISEVAKRHNLWLHVDGSWGGNVVFSKTRRAKVKSIELADSLTVNPHKMLGVPCTCSFLLLPDERTFQQAQSLQAPYLFHNSHDGDNYDLADGTMGCGRRADAVKLYLAWRWYGSDGFGTRIDHAFDVTEYLARKIRDSDDFTLVSEYPPPCLQTCFYYTPKGKKLDPATTSAQTRDIVRKMFQRGSFLVDYSPHSDGSGEFFRVVINAPR
jgi:glutamate decarboxylase